MKNFSEISSRAKNFISRHKDLRSGENNASLPDGFILNPKAVNTGVKIIEINKNDIFKNLDLMRHHYLSGDLILIRDFHFPIDYTIFDFEPVDLRKKAEELGVPEIDMHQKFGKTYKKTYADKAALLVYPDNEVKRNNLLNSMEVVHSTIKNLFISMFPKIKSLKQLTTWRMSKTVQEAYHLDVYKPLVMRAFYNLSDTKRVWGLGHNFIDLMNMNRKSLDEFISSNSSKYSEKSRYMPAILNSKFFNQRLKTYENHDFNFKKKDLWICDSTKVAHQIVSGDKLAALTFEVDRSEIELNYPDFLYENHFESLYTA